MSGVAQLRENSPRRTTVSINLSHEPSDVELARALEGNRFVTIIRLWVRGAQRVRSAQRSDYPQLARAIAARANLKKVVFDDENGGNLSPPEQAVVLMFLEAMNSTSSVKNISFRNFRFVLGSALFTFLCSTFARPKLLLANCDMADQTLREQGARALASAINTQELVIENCNAAFISALLRNLSQNTSVKNLILHDPSTSRNTIMDEDVPTAVRLLLETTTTIRNFELKNLHLVHQMKGEQFNPIAQGLINSNSVCKLSMAGMCFDDNATQQLQSILQKKQNLASLSLKGVWFGSVDNERGPAVLKSISEALTRPGSSLRCLEGPPMVNGFQEMLLATTKSKLDRLKICNMTSQQHLQSLLSIIPSFGIQELEIEVSRPLTEQSLTQGILQAVKKNFNLRSVKGYFDRSPVFFRAKDQRKLAFFFHRNERMHEWVENRSTLDQKLWPEALALAQQAGQDTLYTSLQSVLGSSCVSLRAGRKRKRTKFYSPT